jgi:hypothetical protein
MGILKAIIKCTPLGAGFCDGRERVKNSQWAKGMEAKSEARKAHSAEIQAKWDKEAEERKAAKAAEKAKK